MGNLIGQIEPPKFPTELKDALPFKGLNSRHASAVICKQYGRRKEVMKMNLLMSRSSRAFIISQNGLEGFVNAKHDNGVWLC